MPALAANESVPRNVAFTDGDSDTGTSAPTSITRPRLTDHTGDTPEERSSATATKTREFLKLVFGEVTTMISGENDPVMGMDAMHGIPRSLPRKEPLQFNALKRHIGKHITLKNGEKGRGLNLDSRSNLDCSDPTTHRQYDNGVWSLVPVKPMLDHVARELLKTDGRSYDEICPGIVFEYNVFVYDGRQLPMIVYDEPFRTPQPWTVNARSAADFDDDPALEPESLPTPGHEPTGNITVTPILRQQGDAIVKRKGEWRMIVLPDNSYVVRSTFNPVHVVHNIMSNLIARLSKKKAWPTEQLLLWDKLELPTRPWFNFSIPPRTTRLGGRNMREDDEAEYAPRAGKTKTAPAALTRMTTRRNTAAKPTRTEADVVTTRATRTQPSRQTQTSHAPQTSRPPQVAPPMPPAPPAKSRAAAPSRRAGPSQRVETADTDAASTSNAGPSNKPGLLRKPSAMRKSSKPTN
ncbi:hypothetical protein HDZ31DRAFT_67660 [Schizophyllum fasciatum]